MSEKAFKVLVEMKFRAVSCPGVHLSVRDDVYLSVCFMGQVHQSESLPAFFPLLVHEKMTFEKIFRHAVDPGDISLMLEYESIKIELVQLIPPVGETLAYVEEVARCFLFPEPKLVPCFSGVDREVLMMRSPHFPGIAPRLEFSTKTTIFECSPDAEVHVHPNTLMRPVVRRNRKRPRQLQTTPSQKKSPQIHRGRMDRTLTAWSGAASPDSPFHSTAFTSSSSSPLTRSSSTVRRSSTPRREASFHRFAEGGFKEDFSSVEAHKALDFHPGPVPSALRQSYRDRINRSESSSHTEWEDVHERVRGLLTTPKAVCRLVHGASYSEVEEVLSRSFP